MSRDARFIDTPAVTVLLREMYAASKYAERTEVSDKAIHDLMLGALAGQRQTSAQATFFHVSEQGGQIVGFMIGTLARVYQIGKKLVAQDLFLVVRKGAAAKHSLQMIDAYVAWARSNRNVIEINLSWSDTLPGAERIAAVYQRKGFVRTGEIYEMRADLALEKAA